MNAPPDIYEFDKFRVDAGRRLLTDSDGEILPLKPKAFETLLYFVRHPGELLEKEEMMRAIWTDTVVEENNLNQSISVLRRVLGERHDEHRFIVTVPGRGYKFVAEVGRIDEAEKPELRAAVNENNGAESGTSDGEPPNNSEDGQPAEIRSEAANLESLPENQSEIKAIRSGETVIVSSRWKGKGSYAEGEINDDQRCGQVFVRTGKSWKLLSEHCVQIVSK
jgi:DNA-binding winged helix-turn-helix (wHTH) protein